MQLVPRRSSYAETDSASTATSTATVCQIVTMVPMSIIAVSITSVVSRRRRRRSLYHDYLHVYLDYHTLRLAVNISRMIVLRL